MVDTKITILIAVVSMIYYTGSLWTVITWILGLFLVMVGHLIFNQEKLLYVPDPLGGMIRPEDNPEGFRSPKELQLPFEDLMLDTPDGVRLHCWNIRPERGSVDEKKSLEDVRVSGTMGSSTVMECSVKEGGGDSSPKTVKHRRPGGRPNILFCHANAGNMGLRLPNFKDLYHTLHLNVFAYDYRGFGKSTGADPSEEGLILDALTSLKHMKTQCGVEATYIFGRSLGGAVAIAVAKALNDMSPDERKKNYPRIQGMILENTFASISLLADKLFPFLQYVRPIKDRFLRVKWDSMSRIGEVEVPIIFLVGEKDELVPPTHSKLLKETAKNAKITTFPEGTHNDTYVKGGLAYWQAIGGFLKENA